MDDRPAADAAGALEEQLLERSEHAGRERRNEIATSLDEGALPSTQGAIGRGETDLDRAGTL
jgi:hypothetical protein